MTMRLPPRKYSPAPQQHHDSPPRSLYSLSLHNYYNTRSLTNVNYRWRDTAWAAWPAPRPCPPASSSPCGPRAPAQGCCPDQSELELASDDQSEASITCTLRSVSPEPSTMTMRGRVISSAIALSSSLYIWRARSEWPTYFIRSSHLFVLWRLEQGILGIIADICWGSFPEERGAVISAAFLLDNIDNISPELADRAADEEVLHGKLSENVPDNRVLAGQDVGIVHEIARVFYHRFGIQCQLIVLIVYNCSREKIWPWVFHILQHLDSGKVHVDREFSIHFLQLNT